MWRRKSPCRWDSTTCAPCTSSAAVSCQGSKLCPLSPRGGPHLAYMVSRLDFAIQALVEKELLSDGSMSARRGPRGRPVTTDFSDDHLRQARDLFERAIESGEAAVRASASQVWDDSDRASLATYYHFFVREVRARTSAVLEELATLNKPVPDYL